jgi:hypothetical protein
LQPTYSRYNAAQEQTTLPAVRFGPAKKGLGEYELGCAIVDRRKTNAREEEALAR